MSKSWDTPGWITAMTPAEYKAYVEEGKVSKRVQKIRADEKKQKNTDKEQTAS